MKSEDHMGHVKHILETAKNSVIIYYLHANLRFTNHKSKIQLIRPKACYCCSPEVDNYTSPILTSNS